MEWAVILALHEKNNNMHGVTQHCPYSTRTVRSTEVLSESFQRKNLVKFLE